MSADVGELGPMLRAWRARITPEAAGLPAGRGRRVSGLRREDLAELAGISVDYLVRLEQGRHRTPSAQVVAALARALQLTEAERDHLHRLAGLAAPGGAEVSDHIPPGLRRMLGRLGDSAAAVFAADWQLIWWSPGWSALLGDPSSTPAWRRNFARDTFPTSSGGTGPVGPSLARWPVTSLSQPDVEAAVVADLRRATGRFPRSARLAGLVADLSAGSARFAELWAAGAVGTHREDHKVVRHPRVGPIAVDCDVLTDGDAERKVVVLTAAPGTVDESRFRLARAARPTAQPPETTRMLNERPVTRISAANNRK